MSTVNFDTSNRTTGGLQRFDCLAWVNFNGTGTVAIRASGNVSSITDNGTGDYAVNFTNALPDANYVLLGTCGTVTGFAINRTFIEASVTTAASVRFKTNSTGTGAYVDIDGVMIAVIR